jgi:hypothetical protein
MDSLSQPSAASLSTASAMPTSSSTASLASSNASVLPWPQPTDGGHAFFNPSNTPLLQRSSTIVSAASFIAIVSLSHTCQVISLKLTNTNYLYCRIQMKLYLLGHVLVVDGTSLQVNQFFLCWKQQNQLILSVLLSSLSMEVLYLVVDYQTSSSVWCTLEQALASKLL